MPFSGRGLARRVPTVMPDPQHDKKGSDSDSSYQHGHADQVVMAGGEPAGTVLA